MKFTAELWEHSPGGWCFVTVPAAVGEALADGPGPRRGFGAVRVEVTVGSTTWQTSVFPSKESYILPMKKPVRRAEELEPGDPVICNLRAI